MIINGMKCAESANKSRLTLKKPNRCVEPKTESLRRAKKPNYLSGLCAVISPKPNYLSSLCAVIGQKPNYLSGPRAVFLPKIRITLVRSRNLS